MHGNNMNSVNQSTVERHVKVWNAVVYCGLYLLLSHSRSVLKLSLCCFLHFFHLMNMKRMLLSLSLHQKAHNKCRFLLLNRYVADTCWLQENVQIWPCFLKYGCRHSQQPSLQVSPSLRFFGHSLTPLVCRFSWRASPLLDIIIMLHAEQFSHNIHSKHVASNQKSKIQYRKEGSMYTMSMKWLQN